MFYTVSILNDLGTVFYNRNFNETEPSIQTINIMDSLNLAILNMVNKINDKQLEIITMGLKFTVIREKNCFVRFITSEKLPSFFIDYIAAKITEPEEFEIIERSGESNFVPETEFQFNNLEAQINQIIDNFIQVMINPYQNFEVNISRLFIFLLNRKNKFPSSNQISKNFKIESKELAKMLIKYEIIPYNYFFLNSFIEYLIKIIELMDDLLWNNNLTQETYNYLSLLPILKDLSYYFNDNKFKAALWVETSIF